MAAVLDMDSILGLSLDRVEAVQDEGAIADSEALELLARRSEAKKAKDWAQADEIRNRLSRMGYKVVDTPSGPQLERL